MSSMTDEFENELDETGESSTLRAEANLDRKRLSPTKGSSLADLDRLCKILQNSDKNLGLPEVPLKMFTCKRVRYIINYMFKNAGQVDETLGLVSSNIIATVTSLADSSKSLDAIQSKTRQLADYSSTIASAGEELSATINSITKNVQNTVNASAEAKDLAKTGMTAVDSTKNRIEELSHTFGHANEALETLLGAAEEADKIIRVVNDISSKTDLLSLNASIEAARAGEAGKGFAVVAHEVSRLSEKTQTSISDIENIIENIKKEIARVSEKVEEGNESTTKAVKEITDANNTIENIVNKIEFVDNEVSNIGSAIKEQGQAVTDIAQNVSTISDGSRDVNQEIEKISDTLDSATKRSNATRNELGKMPISASELIKHSKVDHLFWIHRLRRMIEGKEQIKPEEFTDHKACRLGKWYYAVDISVQSAGFRSTYTDLESPHERLHSIAANVIREYNNGNKKEALRYYKECLPISNEIVSRLDLLQKEIQENAPSKQSA